MKFIEQLELLLKNPHKVQFSTLDSPVDAFSDKNEIDTKKPQKDNQIKIGLKEKISNIYNGEHPMPPIDKCDLTFPMLMSRLRLEIAFNIKILQSKLGATFSQLSEEKIRLNCQLIATSKKLIIHYLNMWHNILEIYVQTSHGDTNLQESILTKKIANLVNNYEADNQGLQSPRGNDNNGDKPKSFGISIKVDLEEQEAKNSGGPEKFTKSYSIKKTNINLENVLSFKMVKVSDAAEKVKKQDDNETKNNIITPKSTHKRKKSLMQMHPNLKTQFLDNLRSQDTQTKDVLRSGRFSKIIQPKTHLSYSTNSDLYEFIRKHYARVKEGKDKGANEQLLLSYLLTFVKGDKTAINFRFFANEFMNYFCKFLNLLAAEKQIRYQDYKTSYDFLKNAILIATIFEKDSCKTYIKTYIETVLITGKNFFLLKEYRFATIILNKELNSQSAFQLSDCSCSNSKNQVHLEKIQSQRNHQLHQVTLTLISILHCVGRQSQTIVYYDANRILLDIIYETSAWFKNHKFLEYFIVYTSFFSKCSEPIIKEVQELENIIFCKAYLNNNEVKKEFLQIFNNEQTFYEQDYNKLGVFADNMSIDSSINQKDQLKKYDKILLKTENFNTRVDNLDDYFDKRRISDNNINFLKNLKNKNEIGNSAICSTNNLNSEINNSNQDQVKDGTKINMIKEKQANTCLESIVGKAHNCKNELIDEYTFSQIINNKIKPNKLQKLKSNLEKFISFQRTLENPTHQDIEQKLLNYSQYENLNSRRNTETKADSQLPRFESLRESPKKDQDTTLFFNGDDFKPTFVEERSPSFSNKVHLFTDVDASSRSFGVQKSRLLTSQDLDTSEIMSKQENKATFKNYNKPAYSINLTKFETKKVKEGHQYAYNPLAQKFDSKTDRSETNTSLKNAISSSNLRISEYNIRENTSQSERNFSIKKHKSLYKILENSNKPLNLTARESSTMLRKTKSKKAKFAIKNVKKEQPTENHCIISSMRKVNCLKHTTQFHTDKKFDEIFHNPKKNNNDQMTQYFHNKLEHTQATVADSHLHEFIKSQSKLILTDNFEDTWENKFRKMHIRGRHQDKRPNCDGDKLESDVPFLDIMIEDKNISIATKLGAFNVKQESKQDQNVLAKFFTAGDFSDPRQNIDNNPVKSTNSGNSSQGKKNIFGSQFSNSRQGAQSNSPTNNFVNSNHAISRFNKKLTDKNVISNNEKIDHTSPFNKETNKTTNENQYINAKKNIKEKMNEITKSQKNLDKEMQNHSRLTKKVDQTSEGNLSRIGTKLNDTDNSAKIDIGKTTSRRLIDTLIGKDHALLKDDVIKSFNKERKRLNQRNAQVSTKYSLAKNVMN